MGGAVAALLLVLAVIGYGYWMAGLVGGAIPANAAWREPAQGIEVFVEDNGVHTGIAFPKAMLEGALDGLVAPGDIGDPRFAAHEWLVVGWGDRAFYLETPSWADVRPATVAAALIGSDRTVLHVEHIAQPRGGPQVKAVRLRPEEFARLVAFVRASFAEGQAVRGYAAYDAFYPANGHYNAVHTCNDWTGAAFRAAGVRMGAWTPFSRTVMWWL
ncbi:TIGR02117 family protein [Sphingomonas qomolangmaensis]|uniref:TIGR02117 family protein n=1 Tax=Sphingomonas qomolangmaensis TaxID=2918765 RepID=A0ABY5LDZ4_9SPHN|nr:TIGR02117 family protein [Sphingomonas qomolangmaensis]UUL84321.1 TIGR02117 family protein [Sphingomonas qomolangmaensis]